MAVPDEEKVAAIKGNVCKQIFTDVFFFIGFHIH